MKIKLTDKKTRAKLIEPQVRPSTTDPNLSKNIITALLFLSFIIYVSWALFTNDVWDDDCINRYFHALKAFDEPEMFVSLWNRPLWILVFAIPVKLSYVSVPIIMSSISIMTAYFLYQSMVLKQLSYPFVIIIFLLFQPYFLGTANDAMTEPLAAAIIGISYFLFLKKKWIPFVLLGALLPLARTELAIHLVFWLIPLIQYKQWKLIPFLSTGLILWWIAAGLITGDWLYLYHHTIGSELSENRYGSQAFDTYISRIFYVIGPVVFFFLIMGLVKNFSEKKLSFFIEGQFFFGLLLYTVFAWKIIIGQSAGFLRNLIPLSPLIAILATHGLHYWLKKVSTPKYCIRFILYSLITTLIVFFFYRYELKIHHLKTTEIGYFHLSIVLALLALSVFPWWKMLMHKKSNFNKFSLAIICLISTLCVSFTLITENPNANMNAERFMIQEAVDFYKANNFDQSPMTYASHGWFYWAGHFDKNDKRKYSKITRAAIDKAPEGSIIFWENHYSNRLGSDVPINYLVNSDKFIQIATIYAKDYTRNCFFFIKKEAHKKSADYIEELIQIDTKYPYVHILKAEKLLNEGKYAQSKMMLETAYQIDSTNTYIKYLKGKIASKRGQYKLAGQIFDSIKPAFQEWINWYMERGHAYFYQKDYHAAKEVFEEGISKKKDHGPFYHNLAIALLKLNKKEEGCKQLKKALSLKHKKSETLVQQICQ